MNVKTQKLFSFLSMLLLSLGAGTAEAGLIAHWAMDESAGAAAAVDSIGIADAVPAADLDANKPVAGATGKFGNAWSFNGANDNRLNVAPPNQAAFTTLGFSGWSYSGWFNTTEGASDTIFSISDAAAGSEEAALRVVASKLNFLGRHNANPNVDITGAAALNLGQWYHAAVASDSSGTVLYLDGDPVATSADGVDIATFTTNNNNVAVNFGANNDNGGGLQWEYAGLIDEFRVYDHKLTPAEVTALATIPEPSSLLLFSLAGLWIFRLRR